MKLSWKRCVAIICALLGAMSWLYWGIYRLWKGPIMDLIEAHITGNLTMALIINDLFKAFVCLTVAGFVWCLWYILRGYFKGKD